MSKQIEMVVGLMTLYYNKNKAFQLLKDPSSGSKKKREDSNLLSSRSF